LNTKKRGSQEKWCEVLWGPRFKRVGGKKERTLRRKKKESIGRRKWGPKVKQRKPRRGRANEGFSEKRESISFQGGARGGETGKKRQNGVAGKTAKNRRLGGARFGKKRKTKGAVERGKNFQHGWANRGGFGVHKGANEGGRRG